MPTKHKPEIILMIACMLGLVKSSASAQTAAEAQAEMTMPPAMQAMMQAYEEAAKTGPQHAMLAESVGDWTASVSLWLDPAAEPEVSTSKVTRKLELDGRVVAEAWQGSMMGRPFSGISRTGYDNVTDKYWSTWTDNMSTSLMVMHGDYDADTKTFTFYGDYVDPVTRQRVKTRSVVVNTAPGKELMTMYETHDGEEVKTMQIEMQRD